jgi:short-subunit dehydrogenase
MKKYVYISGATGGFGKSMAVECALRGWNLLLTDLSGEKLDALSRAIRSAYGVEVLPILCDLSDTASRTELIGALGAAGVRLSMAINVAGVDYEGPFLKRTREEVLSILNVNVVSTVDMMHSLVSLRAPGEAFRIVNVCSLAGMFPMPVKATYAATKRLLISMSLALREEFREIGATVTALCPAGMATNELLLKSLDAQGLAGRLTTLEVGLIARRTIDRALEGRAIYIPGALNRLLNAAGRMLPETLVARLIHRHWTKTNRRLEAALGGQA